MAHLTEQLGIVWSKSRLWRQDLAFFHVSIKVPGLSVPVLIPQLMSHSSSKTQSTAAEAVGHKLLGNCLVFNKVFNKPPERGKNEECRWECVGVWGCRIGLCPVVHLHVCRHLQPGHVCLWTCFIYKAWKQVHVCLGPLNLSAVKKTFSSIASTKS